MTPRKKNVRSPKKQPARTRDAAKPGKQQQTPTSRIARIPALVRYIFLLLTSLGLTSGLLCLTSEVTLDKLQHLSKDVEEWEVGVLIAWEGIELALAWIMGFSVHETSTLIFLAHLPIFTLLSSFYKINPTTILVSYAITIIGSALPFALFRKRESPNDQKDQTKLQPSILMDIPTTIYTTLAATSIFSLVLYISYATFLPIQLAAHFDNIPDISVTHAGAAGWPTLFITLLPAGWAARNFLFAAWARAVAEDGDVEEDLASKDGEYLICVLYRKTWGTLTRSTRVLVSRTFVLAAMMLVNTVVQVTLTVAGVKVEGAAVWGSVWAVAGLVVGGVFGWIGGGYVA